MIMHEGNGYYQVSHEVVTLKCRRGSLEAVHVFNTKRHTHLTKPTPTFHTLERTYLSERVAGGILSSLY